MFTRKRDEAVNPFHKLYYEVLDRFHPEETDKAFEVMSETLRTIMTACKKEIDEARGSE